MVLTLWLYVLMGLYIYCKAYDMKCPVTRQWQYRAKQTCTNETTYICLFHEMKSSYEEKCIGPDGIQRGFKLVLRPNVINSHCERSRYQPIKFDTTGNSDCMYQKSGCTDEGLVVHNIGTNSSDTSCRCDYRKGYTFVKTPKNTCYCLPSLEDCTCYRRNCETLTPEYVCLQEDPLSLGMKCQSIFNDVEGIDKGEVIVHHNKDADLRAKDFNVSKRIIGPAVIGMLIIFCSMSIMTVRRHSIIHLKEDKDISDQRKIEFELQGNNGTHMKETEMVLHDNDTIVRRMSQSNTKESQQKQINEKILEGWEKRDIVYFETEFFASVVKTLEEHNCVTLIGASGEGKTLTAIHAALRYRHKTPSYDVLVIYDANELFKSINFKTRQFIVIDDPIGTQCLDEPSLASWLQCSKKLRDCLSCGNFKIIATIRKPLFQKNEMRIKETIFYDNTIDLSSEKLRLSARDRKGVLDQNIQFHKKEINCQRKDAIVNDTYHPGFPLFCHLISSDHSMTSHNEVDPCCVVKAHLKEFFKSEPFHYCCLVLAFMFDNVFDTNEFSSCEDKERFKILNILESCHIDTDDKTCFLELKSGFEALSGAYFVGKRPIYKILHGSITSAVADIYGIDNIITLLEYSGSSVIREYVRTMHDTSDVDNVQIIITPRFQPKLAKRFIKDLKHRESGYVFSHPSFLDEDFQVKFMNALMAMPTSELLEIMSLAPKTENVQLKDIREYTKFALDVAILKSTPIHWLCRLGLYEILTGVLLKTGDELRFLKSLPGHTTPLHFAAGYGHIKVVQYLVGLGVDINLKAQLELKKDPKIGQYFSGFPPLLYAARQNHSDVVEYLLQKGADPNLVRDHGGSPMLLAADRGHTDIIKHLLKYKGDPNLCCDHGTTPIILAAQEGHLMTVLTLIEGGANVNKQKNEKDGKISALSAASKKGHIGCIISLVKNGADIELSDAEGSTPLLIALKNQQYDAARILYEKGSSVNATNKKGEYPLQLATNLNLQLFSDSNKST